MDAIPDRLALRVEGEPEPQPECRGERCEVIDIRRRDLASLQPAGVRARDPRRRSDRRLAQSQRKPRRAKVCRDLGERSASGPSSANLRVVSGRHRQILRALDWLGLIGPPSSRPSRATLSGTRMNGASFRAWGAPLRVETGESAQIWASEWQLRRDPFRCASLGGEARTRGPARERRRRQPPRANISTFGRRSVAALRSSE